MVYDVYVVDSFSHFLELISVSSLLISNFVDVVQISARSCRNRMMRSDLFRYWHDKVILPLGNLIVSIGVEYIELRKLAYGLSKDRLLFQKQLVMSRETVLDVCLQATSDERGVYFWTLLLHLQENLLVYTNFFLTITDRDRWFVRLEPHVLLDLLQAISQSRLRDQNVLHQILDLLREVAGKLIVCR